MNFDGFIPHEFTRFGGLVDNDDPTVLPMGVAAVCRNCRFQLTTVATRYGLQTVMQGPNQVPITGLASLIYTPENPGETLFQVPMVFDTDGYLLVERPAGSGKLVRVQGPLVSQPANAHAIVTEAYNRALIAYSDLKTPSAPINVYGLSTEELDPYGQKPLGASWLKSTAYVVGEYVHHGASVAAFGKRDGYGWRRKLGRADAGAGEQAAGAQLAAARQGCKRRSFRRGPRCLPGDDLRQRTGRVDCFGSGHPGQHQFE
jgi:hypothetical protein